MILRDHHDVSVDLLIHQQRQQEAEPGWLEYAERPTPPAVDIDADEIDYTISQNQALQIG